MKKRKNRPLESIIALKETHLESSFFCDLCMNCGLCAEYCPFDAIKMDREYELASRNWVGNIYNLEKLLRTEAYHAAIHPLAFERECSARAAKNACRTDGG